ncbi:hypothetical protein PAHAL_5G239000 [Panicum hallii]|uniref:SIAH-type domain-containing protein n=1 Tax=Panicum hallii TaxID=206008 RepID=A0A2S3HTT2_9POAL|nr:uncharacterized protein LOC112892464 [Panicum hallii]PAN29626.1 hypothetical protein PAHAL_5G239000 [Panicum hallii]
MEGEGGGGNTAGETMGEARQDAGEMITGSIAVEAFGCHVRAKPLGPPMFECPVGHFFVCSSCRDNLPQDKCKFCSGSSTLARSLGMERAVRSILVGCCYADRGCTEKTAYYDKDEHEMACPHAPRFCPGSPAAAASSPGRRRSSWTTAPATTSGRRPSSATVCRLICASSNQARTSSVARDDDDQLFLVNVRPAARPPGHAVSLVCVPPCLEPTGFGCTVSFSCIRLHRGTSTLDDLQPLRLSDWPPTECICVVPKAWQHDGQNDDDGVVLTITIVRAFPLEDDDNPYDMSYIESDEDDSDSS